MAKIGYIRVSTLEQNVDRQKDSLDNIGMDKIYIDKTSGAKIDRPALKEMLVYLRQGDTLYIHSIDRLARNTKDLLNIIEELTKKEVQIVSLKENIDTSTRLGQFLLTLFAALADLERTNLLERQREGYEAARKRGKKFGRKQKPLPKNWNEIIDMIEKNQISKLKGMKLLNMSSATFYRRYNEFKN